MSTIEICWVIFGSDVLHTQHVKVLYSTCWPCSWTSSSSPHLFLHNPHLKNHWQTWMLILIRILLSFSVMFYRYLIFRLCSNIYLTVIIPVLIMSCLLTSWVYKIELVTKQEIFSSVASTTIQWDSFILFLNSTPCPCFYCPIYSKINHQVRVVMRKCKKLQRCTYPKDGMRMAQKQAWLIKH